MPDYLQLDNELSFRGSNRYPRSFGIVIKTCLYFGVEPVFIPVREPWRNGIIENFNDTYDKKFFRRQWFRNYRHLKRQSKNFQRFHNKHHRYSCLKGKTPNDFIDKLQYQPCTIGPNTKTPDINYIPDGHINIIRFIRSDLILNIFGETFTLPSALMYSYIKAVVATKINSLLVYQNDDLITSFEYRIQIQP